MISANVSVCSFVVYSPKARSPLGSDGSGKVSEAPLRLLALIHVNSSPPCNTFSPPSPQHLSARLLRAVCFRQVSMCHAPRSSQRPDATSRWCASLWAWLATAGLSRRTSRSLEKFENFGEVPRGRSVFVYVQTNFTMLACDHFLRY